MSDSTPASKRVKTQDGRLDITSPTDGSPTQFGSSQVHADTPSKDSRKRASTSQNQAKMWTKGNALLSDISRLSEGTIAGYLGYTDTVHLRHLIWSYPVMKAAMVFESLLKNQLQSHAASILEASLENPGAYNYDTDLSTMISKYNHRSEEEKADQDATNLAQKLLFAAVIYHTANSLETIELLTIEDAQLHAEFTSYRVNSTKVKAFKVPQFDKSAILCPTLGPLLHLNEHPMERYCRTFTCIRYLLYMTTASKFANVLAKIERNTYFAPNNVSSDRLPAWMSKDTVVETPGAEAILELMSLEKQAPKQITLRFVREDGTDDDDNLIIHTNTFLRRRKILLPKEDLPYQHDMSEFDVGSQWRDHLRHVLLLPRLRCDFANLTLFLASKAITVGPSSVHVLGEGPWTMYDNDNPEQVVSWSEVKDILQCGDKFQIRYALKAIDTDEDGPYPFEHDGGPVQLHNSFARPIVTVAAAAQDTSMSGTQEINITVSKNIHENEPLDRKGKGPEIPEGGNGKGHEITEAPPPTPSYLEGVLAGSNTHGIRGTITPDKLFGDCRSPASLAWHLGVDVSTPAGIDAFVRKVVGTLRTANIAPKAAVDLAGLPDNARDEIQAGLHAAAETTLNADINSVQEDSNFDDYYKTQQLFAGDDSHTGPPLNACLEVSQAEFHSWHDQNQTLAKYKLKSLPSVHMHPLGHQVTGFLWMISKAYGHIRAPTEAAQAVAEELLTARTYGGLLVDNMGLGKTYTALLYLSWVFEYHTDAKPGRYKPHLVLAPAGPVIEQWRQDIVRHFKGINLILAYGDSPPNGGASLKWISAKAMRNYPKMSYFPRVFRYIFDKDNKMASKTVILTSYDTLAARTLQKPRRQPGEESKAIQPSEWTSRWNGVFHTVILDEGHKVRNPTTQIHVAVARLGAKRHWFLTGTPVQNQSLDIMGPLNILWTQIRAGLHLTIERMKWLETLKGTYQDFDILLGDTDANDGPALPYTSWKYLIAGDPYRIRQLLNCGNRHTINKFYRCMEQLLVLRRSTATSIPVDGNGARLQLRSLMPPHEITTVQLRMTSAEAAEYQYFHQNFVKDYEEGMELWLHEKQKRTDPNADLKSFPNVAAPMRAMTVNAVSTLLSRFHQTLIHTKVRGHFLDDTVATITTLRSQGFTGLQLAHSTLRKGDLPIKDASDLMRHLTFGSPKIKWILKDIIEHCMIPDKDGNRSKLLCSEEIPVSAWFVETVCKSFYIRAEVLHAGLTDPQRIALLKEFNDPNSSLTVLIMMYAVSSQGANLDGACHRVCSITCAINLPVELQVHYRPIRVSQKKKVTIVRLSVLNSHDAWREIKQIDKNIVDILTKLRSPESFQAIADALNDTRDEVLAAHLSSEGQRLLDGKPTLPLKLHKLNTLLIPDDADLVATAPDVNEPLGVEGAPLFTIAERTPLKRKRPTPTAAVLSDGEEEEPPSIAGPSAEYAPGGTDGESSEEEPDDDIGATIDPGDLSEDDEVELTPTNYIKDFKKMWPKLTPEEKAVYDQDELDFLVLLSMDPNHTYTGTEVMRSLDSAVVERGLRLVIARRSGQYKTGMKVSPHIKYNALVEHNENHDKPFSYPSFSPAHDMGRSAALRRFVQMLPPPMPTPVSEVVAEIAATHLSDPLVHVQEAVLPGTTASVGSCDTKDSNVVEPSVSNTQSE
ncbi:hypothetical protein V498_02502 [Pseudogymnoascus sp. VKM F-4517 (FW-2822)]|nr:hypothetical protein V498_02502 [Pseudogymnoascus sp. VKM F-4517 (FW-2822)]